MPILDQKAVDRRNAPGRRRTPGIDIPIGAAAGVAHHQGVRLVQLDEGQNQMPENGGHQAEFHHRLLDRCTLWFSHPGWVADIEAADLDMRLPAEQVDLQITVNPHLAPGAGGRIAADRSAQLIPVQEVKRDHQADQDRQDHNPGPAQETPACKTAVTKIGQDSCAQITQRPGVFRVTDQRHRGSSAV